MRDELKTKLDDSSETEVNLSGMDITDEEAEEVAKEIIKARPNVEKIYLNNK